MSLLRLVDGPLRLPLVQWKVLSAVLGPVGEARPLDARETPHGRRRKEAAARRWEERIAVDCAWYPASAVKYAAWLPPREQLLVLDAMEQLPASANSEDHDLYAAVLGRNGCSEALLYQVMRQERQSVALWEQFFLSLLARRRELSCVQLIGDLELAGMPRSRLPYLCYLAHSHQRRQYAEVVRLVESMEDGGLEPGCGEKSFAIDALLRLSRVEEAQELFESIVRPDTRVYASYVRGLARSRRSREAVAAFEDARRDGMYVAADQELVAAGVLAYFEEGRHRDAVQVFDEYMLRTDETPSAELMLHGMRSLAKLGDAPACFALLKAMKVGRYRATPGHFNAVVQALTNRGAFHDAKRLIADTLRAKSTDPASNIDADTFNIVAEGAMRGDRNLLALEVLDSMHKLRLSGNTATERLRGRLEDKLLRPSLPREKGRPRPSTPVEVPLQIRERLEQQDRADRATARIPSFLQMKR